MIKITKIGPYGILDRLKKCCVRYGKVLMRDRSSYVRSIKKNIDMGHRHANMNTKSYKFSLLSAVSITGIFFFLTKINDFSSNINFLS